MHYFWFVPLFVVLAVGVWVFYLLVARGLPKSSDRSVADALEMERQEDERDKARSGIGS